MKRYGYLDMPTGYTDMSDWPVKAVCHKCNIVIETVREDCWYDDNNALMTLCTPCATGLHTCPVCGEETDNTEFCEDCTAIAEMDAIHYGG